MISRFPDVTVLNLTSTHRLGADTVSVIAPLYGFGFDSKRPQRWLTAANGERLPEVGCALIDEAPSTAHLGHLQRAADAAAMLTHASLNEAQPDGSLRRAPLLPQDLAVVVAHNSQANGIGSILAARGLDGVTVGTADRLQGGEWAAVVALDPIIGHSQLSEHQLNLGRLCVMLSRHRAALLTLHDGRADILYGPPASDGSRVAAINLAVRNAILSGPR